MIKLFRDFRLIPIVLVAAVGLFVLKVYGIVADGGYTLGAGRLSQADRIALDAKIVNAPLSRPSAPARPSSQSWAQEMFNYPDVTGSVGATKPPAGDADKADEKKAGDKDKKAANDTKDADKKDDKDKKETAKPAEPKPSPGGRVVSADPKPLSPAERAILERLGDRRQELDERAKELDMRETLLQEAEKRIEARVLELKATEARINSALKEKDESDASKFKSLVTMYESMKAKDAAKIFERLDIKLATEVANQINPRRMSDILAQMSPETAERLTVELANRSANGKGGSAADLPKIEGRPNGS